MPAAGRAENWDADDKNERNTGLDAVLDVRR